MKKSLLLLASFLILAPLSADVIEIKGDTPDAAAKLQKALIEANPSKQKVGNTIRLSGMFVLNEGLSLNANGVTIEGQGMDETKLVFANVKPGGTTDGISVTGNNFTIRKLTIQNAAGNALKINGSDHVHIDSVKTEWTRKPPSNENGPYGIYPVGCKNVTIENSEAYGAADAGIYLGQSTTAIVRHNKARENVIGIEVENSSFVDVSENETTGNTAGMLIVDLPILADDPKPKVGGHRIRIFKNKIVANNHKNFAEPGSAAGGAPSGSGLIVMASTEVEAFENDILDNQTTNLTIGSYAMTGETTSRKDYNPYPKSIYIHDNKIANGGKSPSGGSSEKSGELIKAISGLMAAYQQTSFPDMIWDGISGPKVKPTAANIRSKLKICLKNNQVENKPATFANIDLAGLLKGKPHASMDLKIHDCTVPALPVVKVAND